MAEFEHMSFKVPKDHRWPSRKGWNVFVADRGAVRFHCPRTWIIKPQEGGSVQFRDRPEPDDNCLLEISVIHLNPDMVWVDLPLEDLLRDMNKDDGRNVTWEPAIHPKRHDCDLVTLRGTFIDPNEKRLAFSHACLGYNNFIMPFITYVYWADDQGRFGPIWEEVLRSMRIGEAVTFRGPLEPGRGLEQATQDARRWWETHGPGS